MPKNRYGITLIELIVALILMFIVVLGISSIDVFSHRQVIAAERRAKLQNEATFLLEHMAKNIANATGNNNIVDQQVVNTTTITGGYDSSIQVHVAGADRISGYYDSPNHWIAYAFINNSGIVNYCGNCSDAVCSSGCNSAWESAIASRISGFAPAYDPVHSYIDMTVSTCWDITWAIGPCGGLNNPQINMTARLQMPSVSTN
ncbi:MAG: prepilin-type N-terminal cleavage/methylation domain-containing protein [Candidatus Omnitrophota bacterium]